MARISRRSFIRKATAGAVAASGLAASSDYLPPDVVLPPPGDGIEELADLVRLYPSGDGDTDYENLRHAINDIQKKVHLMPKSRAGMPMPFMLPDCPSCEGYAGVQLMADAEILGQGQVTIQGGMTAFHSYGEYSFSARNILFKGQELAAVLGRFSDFSLVASGSDPIPLPGPNHGFVLDVLGSIGFINNDVKGSRVGLFCMGSSEGKVSGNSFGSQVCGLYLAGGGLNVSGNSFDAGGIANILLEGEQVVGNSLSGNRLLGNPYANIVIWEGVEGTKVRLGGGSVASGSDPIPLPGPSILDMGTGTDIKGRYRRINDPAPVQDDLYALMDEMYSLLAIE